MKTLREQIDEFTFYCVKQSLINNDGDIQNACAELEIYPKQMKNYRDKFTELNKLISKRKSGRESSENRNKRLKMERRFPA